MRALSDERADHDAIDIRQGLGMTQPSKERMRTLAKFLRSQIELADRPPVGRVELNNEEAEICRLALEACADAIGDRPKLLREETSQWEIETKDDEGRGVYTCHARVVGGVLCRWWGDGAPPPGAAAIDWAVRLLDGFSICGEFTIGADGVVRDFKPAK